jgi:transposase
LEDWPPHSPDLNVIELVWAWMKTRVAELNPSTEIDLMNILIQVWDELKMEHVNKLVDSMQRRIRMV